MGSTDPASGARRGLTWSSGRAISKEKLLFSSLVRSATASSRSCTASPLILKGEKEAGVTNASRGRAKPLHAAPTGNAVGQGARAGAPVECTEVSRGMFSGKAGQVWGCRGSRGQRRARSCAGCSMPPWALLLPQAGRVGCDELSRHHTPLTRTGFCSSSRKL